MTEFTHKDGLEPCPGASRADDETTWRHGRFCVWCDQSYHCGKCGRGSGMMGHYTKIDGEWVFSCQPQNFDRGYDDV